MSEYTVKAEKLSLPLVALSGNVAFPGEIVNLEITDDSFGSQEALREAFDGSKYVIAVPIKSDENEPLLFEIGTVIKIKQLIGAGDKTVRCIAEGMSRAAMSSYRKTGRFHTAEVICKTVTLPDGPGIKNQAYLRRLAEAHACVSDVELLPFRTLCREKYEALGIPFPFGTLPEPTREQMERLNRLLVGK